MKKEKIKGLPYIIMAIFVGFLLYSGIKEIVLDRKEPIDLSVADWSTLQPGDKVMLETNAILDHITNKEEDGHVVERMYAVPKLVEDADGNLQVAEVIGLKLTDSDDCAAAYEIVKDTQAWREGKSETLGTGTFQMVGVLEQMKPSEKEHMEKYVSICFSILSYDVDMYPYAIREVDTRKGFWNISLALVIIGIFSIPKLVNYIKLCKKKKDIEAQSVAAGFEADSERMSGGAYFGDK